MADSFIDALVAAMSSRSRVTPSDVVPVALLWPDQAEQWRPLIPFVKERRRVLELGEYDPDNLRGPAYWIKGVLDGVITLPATVEEETPVVYLPGYARSDIRAVEEADARLKPIAELQYRGTIFAQQNGRDWTLAAFLQSKLGGLGIDVGEDDATKEALLRARAELPGRSVPELLAAAPLRAPYFDSLLAPDLDRDVLRWLNDSVAFRASLKSSEWEAFRSRFKDRFGLGLEDGEVAAAGQLGRRVGAWGKVWQRYAEAPDRYPTVEDHLRSAAPKRVRDSVGLFDGPLGAWPQDNVHGEKELRAALVEAATLDSATAAARIASLEAAHAARREWVWAARGESPLAVALEHLALLAEASRHALPAGEVTVLVDAYTSGGWRTDDAVMRALAATTAKADREAVARAARTLYEGWLDAGARRFQEAVGESAAGYVVEALVNWDASTCLVFVDGLRFDVGKRVEAELLRLNQKVSIRPHLAALPTITSTAKPAISPVVEELGPGGALSPMPKAGGADLAISGLRSLLQAEGYQVLQEGETGDPSGRAWTEHGDVDELGHKQQAKLPALLDGEVRSLCERITGLLEAGWAQVVVVTDHGWLYLPGCLPKVDLPYYLTKDERMKKGRTGRLADGAAAPGGTVPWFWDRDVRMAVAPGITAFVAGATYEHGGVSPQECITPVITVGSSAAAGRTVVELEVSWRGLWADVVAIGAPSGSRVDLRTQAGAESSSVAKSPQPVDEGGTARLLVPDSDLEGAAAFLVLVDADGRVLSQAALKIGGDD